MEEKTRWLQSVITVLVAIIAGMSSTLLTLYYTSDDVSVLGRIDNCIDSTKVIVWSLEDTLVTSRDGYFETYNLRAGKHRYWYSRPGFVTGKAVKKTNSLCNEITLLPLRPYEINDSLVVSYSFELGSTCEDGSGNSLHGTEEGFVRVVTEEAAGKEVAVFESGRGFVDLPDMPDLIFDGDFSVVFWIKVVSGGDLNRLEPFYSKPGRQEFFICLDGTLESEEKEMSYAGLFKQIVVGQVPNPERKTTKTQNAYRSIDLIKTNEWHQIAVIRHWSEVRMIIDRYELPYRQKSAQTLSLAGARIGPKSAQDSTIVYLNDFKLYRRALSRKELEHL